MRIKNWIEWIPQMSKIWEKIRTRTYCKFLFFPFKLWVTIWAGKPDDKRNIFTLWQEFRSQYIGKYRWIPLLLLFSTGLKSNLLHMWWWLRQTMSQCFMSFLWKLTEKSTKWLKDVLFIYEKVVNFASTMNDFFKIKSHQKCKFG